MSVKKKLKAIWKCKNPHKIKLFVWKYLKEIVPTRDKIARYKHDIKSHCRALHIFLDFSHARYIWLGVNVFVSTIRTLHGNFLNWIVRWFSPNASNVNIPSSDNKHTLFLFNIIIWCIWKDRWVVVF